VSRVRDGREDSLPFRRVKLLPGSMLSTIPLNCAPGGELSVTSMVSPMNWFDIFLQRVFLHRRRKESKDFSLLC